MPRYFFHIRDAGDLIEDEEGRDLPDLNAAREEARLSAQDIVAEKMRADEIVTTEAIEIADETGTVVETVPLVSVIGSDA
jgi:hypothetical protein